MLPDFGVERNFISINDRGDRLLMDIKRSKAIASEHDKFTDPSLYGGQEPLLCIENAIVWWKQKLEFVCQQYSASTIPI